MRLLSVGAVLLLVGACGTGGYDSSKWGSDPGNDMSPVIPRGNGPRAHTLYVNFDGALVSPATHGDARRNLSDVIGGPGTVPPLDASRFGGGPTPARPSIVTMTQQLFA